MLQSKPYLAPNPTGMFDITIHQNHNYVQLTCEGPASLESLMNVVDRIHDGEFRQGDIDKYLIDLRPIRGTIGTIQRYELGVYIAKTIPTIFVAAISKQETHNKVGENVAVNRGAKILATDNEDEARAWLMVKG